jgi:hypothetical protein
MIHLNIELNIYIDMHILETNKNRHKWSERGMWLGYPASCLGSETQGPSKFHNLFWRLTMYKLSTDEKFRAIARECHLVSCHVITTMVNLVTIYFSFF